ncbi:hypothetical protein [Hymenobacter glacialis]|uniref:PsbP C-terminal domain-containing protein n=1 Tax=Hymenobacter glacialis TaxID=1908236 RepID=A0A1G1T1P9_9BACT|nr:hypothetical protein [Hymenobacter glacialis]OGX84767.1 hypothetical protein BEN48_15675 [Hymenobacter glacialis]
MKISPFLLLLFGLLAFAPKPKLTNVKLGSGLTVGVPATFAPLPDDGIAVKYPSPRKPLAVYSDRSGRVDYSVAVRPTTFESMDYGVLLKIYKSSIQRLYTKVDFIKEDIRTVNGRDFMYFEFVSTVADSQRANQLAPIKRYQAVQYAIQGQQLYIFTFVAPANEQAQWQPTAQAVMNAIVLK